MNAALRPPPLPESGERWAMFFDVDGTLVDIMPHPDHVLISAETLRLLARTSTLLDGAVALLSGRSQADLDRLAAPFQFPMGAVHGVELRDACGEYRRADPPEEFAARVARDGAEGVRQLEGVWLEDKNGVAFALHYRAARWHEDAVLRLADSIARTSSGHYVVQPGDCVAELKPAGASKGTALLALMDTAPFSGRRPVMLGDDLTDESAFAAVREASGIGVVVGPRRPTLATHALATPLAVHAWLARVAARLANRRVR